jgi:hypothetical protein
MEMKRMEMRIMVEMRVEMKRMEMRIMVEMRVEMKRMETLEMKVEEIQEGATRVAMKEAVKRII